MIKSNPVMALFDLVTDDGTASGFNVLCQLRGKHSHPEKVQSALKHDKCMPHATNIKNHLERNHSGPIAATVWAKVKTASLNVAQAKRIDDAVDQKSVRSAFLRASSFVTLRKVLCCPGV